MENGEAICCFGEAIAFYDYSVSSGHFFSRFEIVIGPGPGPGPELDKNVRICLCIYCTRSCYKNSSESTFIKAIKRNMSHFLR